ncbi:Porphobilinogen deaminase [Streptomyces sp. ADI95-16]|uniref:hydroxymethylbilane synthase n=1 Tax=Streptomyces sp. ADI95-16 TaxID=1522758 RepID=UPI000F3A9D47|nr:hydroxymethylbilane synthase [Streptomyces sp. ADI95-16]AYV29606.1 Porphobilinogen deaminase [Streptomyces sp. ADI95-16]
MTPLRIGARASLMSLMQTAPLMAKLGPTPMLLRPFHDAAGDRQRNRAPLEAEGVFSEEIESALLSGEIDVAVHCLKDAPTHDTAGTVMAAYLPRDDRRDALITREPGQNLAALSPGARIGTASVRRTVALRHIRPDVEVVPMRGPINSRLRAMEQGEVDALIVATCSMERLGQSHRIGHRINPEIICPPLGAAIIALQTREDDMGTRKAIFGLHHADTEVEAEAERLILRRLGGFCNAPFAGHCTTTPTDKGSAYTIRIRAFSPDGRTVIEVRETGFDATEAAIEACQRLIRHGGRELDTVAPAT